MSVVVHRMVRLGHIPTQALHCIIRCDDSCGLRGRVPLCFGHRERRLGLAGRCGCRGLGRHAGQCGSAGPWLLDDGSVRPRSALCRGLRSIREPPCATGGRRGSAERVGRLHPLLWRRCFRQPRPSRLRTPVHQAQPPARHHRHHPKLSRRGRCGVRFERGRDRRTPSRPVGHECKLRVERAPRRVRHHDSRLLDTHFGVRRRQRFGRPRPEVPRVHGHLQPLLRGRGLSGRRL